jgi:hypothetical protein
MKKCSNCKQLKSLNEFYKNKASLDGFCNRCKLCDKEYKKADHVRISRRKRDRKNRDKKNAYQRKYAKEHRIQMSMYQKRYADKNREKIRALNRKSYNSEKQKPKNNAKAAKRRALKLSATLAGYDKQIVEIYKNCPPGYHVDHIMPLKGKNSCGLHVPWNLQYLPAIENLKKGNRTIL